MSAKKTDTYTAAMSRLKTLVDRLESAQVDVDELEAVVKESVELVTVCRSRLRSTQTSVDTLLTGLQEDAPATAGTPDGTAAANGSAKHEVPVSAVSAEDVEEIDPFADD